MSEYNPVEYKSLDFGKVIAYDVVSGQYNEVYRVARFEDEADAERFRDAYNNDLRDGISQMQYRGEMGIEQGRDILRWYSVYVVDVHDIPVVPKGAPMPEIFEEEYGSHAQRQHKSTS